MKTYSEKLKDPRWQKKRLEIMDRDKFECQACFDPTKTLNVHHFYYDECELWEYDNSALITLCEDCHKEEEFLKSFTKSSIEYLVSLGFLRIDISKIISTISHRTDEMSDIERREYFTDIINAIIML